jgi:hypothetical protein
MASSRYVVLAGICALVASQAAAQAPDKLTTLQIAVACAPPPVVAMVPDMAAVINGSQDTVARRVFGASELLTVTGGMDRGLQLGQEYFARRIFTTAENHLDKLPHQEQTVGWVRIVAVNQTTAVAIVDHACSDILVGDFLEPFQAPALPESDVTAVDTSREPDFTSISKVLYGAEEKRSVGAGEFVLIERGEKQNPTVGAHYAIYRDLKVAGAPLSSIGEATVVSIGPTMALIRINRSRDAVFSGDLAIPRK